MGISPSKVWIDLELTIEHFLEILIEMLFKIANNKYFIQINIANNKCDYKIASTLPKKLEPILVSLM